MGERKITLFEYHSHDGGIELFSQRGNREGDAEPATGGTGPNAGVAVMIGLAFLVIAGAVFRYMQRRRKEANGDFHQVEVTEFES